MTVARRISQPLANSLANALTVALPDTGFAHNKVMTIPTAQQAGSVTGGVYPILLGDLDGLSTHGRDLVIKQNGSVIPHCRIERRHIALLDGAWIFYGSPSVIYDPDAGVSGQIYVGVVTSDGYRNIAAYDIDDGEYTLYQFSSEDIQIDDHNQPSFCINGDGKLVVAYTEHAGDLKTKVANTAHDLSGGFAATVEPASGNGSYCNLFYLASLDKLFLWTRTSVDSSWYLTTSTDGGASWATCASSIKTDTVNNYSVFWSNDDDVVWVAFNECKPNGTEPYNRAIYCVQYDGTNFKEPDGTTIGTAIPNRAAITGDSVLFAQTADVIKRSVIDIMAGADGHPRVLYYVYPDADEATNHELWHARWTGSAWVHSQVCDEGPSWVPSPSESYAGAAQFCRADINELATCVSTGVGKKEVQIWRTTDNGATWAKSVDVTVNSIEHNTRPRYAHGMTSGLKSTAKTPHLFWMGNGNYPAFTSFKHAIKAYPADYAYGALIKVDTTGSADIDLQVQWGSAVSNGEEDTDLLSDLGLEFANFGVMRLNDSHVSANMVDYGAEGFTKDWRFPRLIHVEDGDTWPMWRKSIGTVDTLRFTPSYHGETEVSSVHVGKRISTGAVQHLISNNVASPLALVIMRLDSTNKLQWLVYQTSAFASLTADAGIGTDLELLAAVFDAGTVQAVRQGETEKTSTPSAATINAAGSTATAAVNTKDNVAASTPYSGPCFICMNGRVVLSKAYTDTLSRAAKTPSSFCVES